MQTLVRPPYRLAEEQGEHPAVHDPSVAVQLPLDLIALIKKINLGVFVSRTLHTAPTFPDVAASHHHHAVARHCRLIPPVIVTRWEGRNVDDGCPCLPHPPCRRRPSLSS